MGKPFYVRMTIPVPCLPIVGVPSLHFAGWLPTSDSHPLIVEKDRLRLSAWFDPSTVHRPPGKDISQLANVPVNDIKVEVSVSGLDEEFIKFMITHNGNAERSPFNKQLRDQFESLGKDIYKFTITLINRLINYFKVEKKHYWLQDLEAKPDYLPTKFWEFKAECSTDRIKWQRWMPTNNDFIKVILVDRDCFTSLDDWLKAGEYVRSGRSSNFVMDLLTTAIANACTGNRRSALVEAVTALEVAIAEFGRAPEAERAFGPVLAKRMDVELLKNQVSHMGNSATIRYLFPVIFPESIMPTELLKVCSDAIEMRNNVVHNGQRDVPYERLHKFVSSIEKLCSTLQEFTKKGQNPMTG